MKQIYLVFKKIIVLIEKGNIFIESVVIFLTLKWFEKKLLKNYFRNACRKKTKSILEELLWEIHLYKIFQPVLITIFVSLLFQQSVEYPGVVMYEKYPVKERCTIYILYMYIYRNIC